MDAFVFFFSMFFAFIFFLPVSYILDAFIFRRHIRKYNSMMPEPYQIPHPTRFKELLNEYRRYKKRMWLLHYQMYQYHEYITEEDHADELH